MEYAHHTFKALLQAVADLSSRDRNRINAHLADIPRLIEPGDYVKGIAYTGVTSAGMGGMLYAGCTNVGLGAYVVAGLGITVPVAAAVGFPLVWAAFLGSRLLYIGYKARTPDYGPDLTPMLAAMQRDRVAHRRVHQPMHRPMHRRI